MTEKNHLFLKKFQTNEYPHAEELFEKILKEWSCTPTSRYPKLKIDHIDDSSSCRAETNKIL